MLALTRKTEYALLALAHLAQNPDKRNNAREIATRYNMRLPLLMNILKVLGQTNIVHSVRGPRGGYKLSLPTDQISLADIIRTIEGPIHLVMCANQPSEEALKEVQKKCDMSDNCPIQSPIHKVHHRLVKFLSNVTLADLINNTACMDTDVSIHAET